MQKVELLSLSVWALLKTVKVEKDGCADFDCELALTG